MVRSCKTPGLNETISRVNSEPWTFDPGQGSGDSRAYLDIETSYEQRITVVGIYRPDRDVLQLVGRNVTAEAINDFLAGSSEVLTYNGHRFDLPIIKSETGVDIRAGFRCRDLMHDCWRRNLKGGLKNVEKQLDIGRETEGVDGRMAMRLWRRYVEYDDEDAMKLLLQYNRDDIVNLETLRQTLDNLG